MRAAEQWHIRNLIKPKVAAALWNKPSKCMSLVLYLASGGLINQGWGLYAKNEYMGLTEQQPTNHCLRTFCELVLTAMTYDSENDQSVSRTYHSGL